QSPPGRLINVWSLYGFSSTSKPTSDGRDLSRRGGLSSIHQNLSCFGPFGAAEKRNTKIRNGRRGFRRRFAQQFQDEWKPRATPTFHHPRPGVRPETLVAGEPVRCRCRIWIHRGRPTRSTWPEPSQPTWRNLTSSTIAGGPHPANSPPRPARNRDPR